MGGWTAWIGPAIVAALISSAVTALGWWVSHRREAEVERRRRREKIVDIQKALRAEVRAYRLQLAEVDLAAHREEMTARILKDAAFAPLVPREAHDSLFRALIEEVHVLPTAAVEPVVDHYALVAAIAAFADDLRGDRFQKDMAPERRAIMYAHFIDMKIRAAARAEAALSALAAGIAAGERGDDAALR
jgi:hypothetical protein